MLPSNNDRKTLVIDADIAYSARELAPDEANEEKYQRIGYCISFLNAIRENEHRIVYPLNGQLKEEWDNHQKEYFSGWVDTMISENLATFIPHSENDDLRDLIESCTVSCRDEGVRNKMIKDTHLLEIALESDKIVASMDKVRQHFVSASKEIKEIREIVWVNPQTEEDSCTGWLMKGAPVEPERQLGYLVNR